MPEKNELLCFLPSLLGNNPLLKYRVKLPYSLEFQTVENAEKMKDILNAYPTLFAKCNRIVAFHYSSAGNK